MCNRCNDRFDNDDIRDTLCRNLGKVVIIYPTCGGRAGDGFRGLLTNVGEDTCTLVSSLPRGPIDEFDRPSRRRSCDFDRDFLGTATTFPLNRIGCVSSTVR